MSVTLRISIAIIVVNLTAVAALGQTDAAALGQLRQHLGLANATAIETKGLLSGAGLVKVNLDMLMTPDTRTIVEKEINIWTKKNAAKYDPISLVPTASDADLLIVRFDGNAISRTVNLPAAPVGGSAPSGSTHTFNSVPMYAYIVARAGDRYSILWSGREWKSSSIPDVEARRIVRELTKLVRERKR